MVEKYGKVIVVFMERVRTFVLAILAGMCISIGGWVFLSVDNKVIGSTLFTIGLFVVCTFGYNLYTGKVCYVFENDKNYALNVPIIWLGNLVGTYLTAFLIHQTRVSDAIVEKAIGICDIKLGDDLLSIFILACFCNLMIFIGVDGYKNNPHEIGKYLALFFGVIVFILCGFEHCVANMFYFSVAGVWSLRTFGYLIVMTIGNAVGGVFIPVIRKMLAKA